MVIKYKVKFLLAEDKLSNDNIEREGGKKE